MKKRLICIFIILVIISAGASADVVLKHRLRKSQDKIEQSNTNKENSPRIQEEAKKEETKHEDAKSQNEKAVEDKYNEGYEAFNNNKYSEAVKIEDEVIDKNADYYKAYSVKGIAQCYSHKYEEGMANIDKALSIKPDYGYGRFNKALAYELYGYYDEALSWYNKALEVEKYVWSYYGIASIYGRRGDVENTVKYLRTAMDMDSDVKAVAKHEKDFDNVRGNKEFDELVK
jgi:tetratricopeptide (TPR) repeat protein